MFRFVFAVGLDAQILWITLWLTRGATQSEPHATGLTLDRLNFEQHFFQSNQQLARGLVGVMRTLPGVGGQSLRLWTTRCL